MFRILLILFSLSDYYSRYEFNVKKRRNIIEIILLYGQVATGNAGVLNRDFLIDHLKSTKKNASTVVDSFQC